MVIVTVWGKLWRGILVTAALPLFCFTSTIAGQQNPGSRRTHSPQASRLLAEAQTALAQWDPKQPLAILSSHLQAHAKDIRARPALGQAYLIAGQKDQADPV